MRPFERVLSTLVLSLVAIALPVCGGNSADSGSSESHFLKCDRTEDCAELGSSFECVDGFCKAACSGPGCDETIDGASSPSDAAGELGCSERESMASGRVAEAEEAADRSCTTTADCLSFSDSSDCHHGCGAIASVEGAASVQAVIDELNAGFCAQFLADGCRTLVHPCPSPGFPACVAGECIAHSGVDLGQPCSQQCGNICYTPGTGENPICSQRCTTDEECGPAGLCQASGGTGRWCFRRCASDAECLLVNDSAGNPLHCAKRIDPFDDYGYGYGGPYDASGEGFCIQASEP